MTFWLFYERQTRLHSSKEKKQKDQNNILGGGLLFFIRTDIVFEKLHSFKKAGMGIFSIRLETTKSTLECISTKHFPSSIKPGPSSLILDDRNSYSQIWDPVLPPDSRGDEILDWILDNNLHILNDSSTTRTS